MVEAKTLPTPSSVETYLEEIPDKQRREDCRELIKIMTRVTGCSPVIWGSSLIGFGQYHYRYSSGHSGDSFLTGFSSRLRDISIYTQIGFEGRQPLLAKLGKHKTGKACLYVRRLSDINLVILEEIIVSSVVHLQKHASEVRAK